MTTPFLPYGIAVEGTSEAEETAPIRIDFFAPYGASNLAALVTKTDNQKPPQPPKSPRRSVVRINSGNG